MSSAFRLAISKEKPNQVVDQNAAIVPQIAITVATPKNTTSQNEARPAIATFAEIGPITQSKKEENEPRKAIIELNSGTKIDTPIENMTNIVRSMIVNVRFRV